MEYSIYNQMKDLLRNKVNGIDCSEQESAEIKGFLKETWHRDDFSTNMIRMAIVRHFPLEYSEAVNETENDN